MVTGRSGGGGGGGGNGGTGGGSATPMFQEWLQQLSNSGKLKPNENITEQLKEELMKTWKELEDRFKGTEAKELATICSKAGEVPTEGIGNGHHSMKTFCKGMMEVRYFISGLKSGNKNTDPVQVETVQAHEWYPRCIVGAATLSTIYGDHCKLGDVVQKVQGQMNSKLEGHKGKGAELDKCKGLTDSDILFGKSILRDRIRSWAQADRGRANTDHSKNRAIQRVGSVMLDRDNMCGTAEKQRKQQLKNNTKSMTSFLRIGDNAEVGSSDSRNLFDVLVNDDLTLPPETLNNILTPIVNTASTGQVDPQEMKTAMEKVAEETKKTQAEACMKQDGKTLCQRLECAEQYWKLNNNGQNTQKDFWKESGGEVATLWNELSDAMIVRTKSTECNTVDGSRIPTEPEKKACQHLTTGFTKLKKLTSTASMDTSKYPILSQHPSLGQTVGCFLLKEYARRMEEKSTCPIDSGLKKAFDTAGNGLLGNCNWGENLDNCNVTTGTTSVTVKNKVDPILGDDDLSIEAVTTHMNEMMTLCDQLKCAAPNWFKEHKKVNGNSATTKTWCDFWKEGVGAALQKMFSDIQTNGNNNTNTTICQMFGDGNTDSVERKACNHIIAGLEHIKGITGDTNGAVQSHNAQAHDKFFKQSMMCAALNLYATKIREASKGKCPIDESKIKEMFADWHKINKFSPSSSCSNEIYGCFKCQRNDKILEGCNLSVSNTLINTSQSSGTCPSEDNTNRENVPTELNKFLNYDDPSKSISQVKETLSTINDMSNSFCTQLQCAAKQYVNKKKGQSTDVSWEEVWNKVKEEVSSLGNAMSDHQNSSLGNHCSTLNTNNKELCLLFGAGLKHLYNHTNGNGDDAMKLFKRTMACAALNVYADQIIKESQEKKCPIAEEEINKMFDKWNQQFKSSCRGGAGGANTNDCFECKRESTLRCTIDSDEVKSKLDPMLNKDTTGLKKYLGNICGGQCKNMDSLCGRAQCAMKQWFPDRGKNQTVDIEKTEMWTEVKNEVTSFDKALPDNGATDTEPGNLCAAVTCPNVGEADCVSKTTCKLIVKALKNIHEMKGEDTVSGPRKVNDRIFKSTMRCVALNAFIHKLKQQAYRGGYACAVEKGIKEAFKKGEEKRKDWCGENSNGVGNGDGSCEKCEERLCFGTKIGKDDDLWSTVMNKLNTDSSTDTNIQPTLKKIKEKVTLCDRVNCIAKWYHKKKGQGKGEDTFWTKDVKELWTELSTAMTATKGEDTNGGKCNTMGDDNREGTHSEKTACNYLHAGFKQLYEPDTSLSTGNDGILSKKYPSFRQTMGCFLLHAYAKKMKSDAKCLVESGIKKAFKLSDSLSKSANCKGGASGKGPCVPCQWEETDYENCSITTNGKTEIAETKVQDMVKNSTLTTTMNDINKTESLCDKLKCAAPRWFKNKKGTNGSLTQTWCQFWDGAVKDALQNMFNDIAEKGKNNKNAACQGFGDGNEHSVERKACNHITAGLQHLKDIKPNDPENQLFERTVGCIALNMYATKIKEMSQDKCPIDEERIKQMFNVWNKNKNSSCLTPGSKNNCFVCTRQKENFNDCKLSVASSLINTTAQSGSTASCTDNDSSTNKNVSKKMDDLLKQESKMEGTLKEINEMDTFCSRLQCAAKQYYIKKNPNGQSSEVTWNALKEDIGRELTALLINMNDPKKQLAAAQYCNDANVAWNTKGHTERRTNKAACLLFAAGLKHIYNQQKGHVNGPSFGQTMGCLFLKEYAKQLKVMAKVKKQGHSWVHPLCSIDEGIKHAFSRSEEIMNATSSCKTSGTNDCFVCKENDVYDNCKIGQDKVGSKSNELFTEDSTKQTQMEKTLENTVCPILLTDILTPFVPLAPVSIGLSAMAYYLWKYFGPLGKGGARLRRSPTEIPGSSVQEQLHDHVQQDSSHEYRLVKERKPRSAPTRTKRSGRANRRTIIEIHFEVLDECQKGDTQLNQKDFLELLVQEFMGSEFMEEEQVPKEGVLMEGVPLELVPMERVPSLGSGFMV
ncbi:SICAvar, type I [Plasmodium knowlesi strain H]|uniref:SICAvar, type I n=2 Tax=Plasmodium knowlesi TaxID=5850 RepID=A0A679KX00_PLAKH|nr:SICAvar, type I [Plasmodium knowlesi strain H]OTN64445.1 SICAvar type I [Plasmodium knowlesi]CAA9989274.1 SICAvar, type I [Plasmodium knowlesi strain H]VVS78748.1 SICAvar, type I [Plasmodium knowlesi strain H]